MPKPETCGRCGAEVRFGVRPSPARPPADQGSPYWMHRDIATDLEHTVILGTPWTPELQVKLDAALAEMAARGKADTKKKQEKAEEEDEGPDVWDQVPPPEVPAHPVDIASFPPRSGIRQMYNVADRQPGWEVRSLTASRGPFVGARGQVLSISDSVLMRMRGQTTLDGETQVAVAFWRDGKFKFAYTGMLKGDVVATQPANSEGLKAFIRGE